MRARVLLPLLITLATPAPAQEGFKPLRLRSPMIDHIVVEPNGDTFTFQKKASAAVAS